MPVLLQGVKLFNMVSHRRLVIPHLTPQGSAHILEHMASFTLQNAGFKRYRLRKSI